MKNIDPQFQQGELPSTDSMTDILYSELKKLARRRLNGEHRRPSINSTDLVHEAYLRLSKDVSGQWSHRGHFFVAASEAMRRILIDRARRKTRKKHGGGRVRVEFEDIVFAIVDQPHSDFNMLLLEDALQLLESEDPRSAEIVKLRFFAGLSVEQVAQVLEISPRTVSRDWAFGRARLYEIINQAE